MSVSLRFSAITSCALLVLLITAEAANTSRPQADSFAKKLAIIKQHAAESPKSSRRTTVTEGEVNSWFVYRGRPYLPAGVTDPSISMLGGGSMRGVATLDLEAIGRRKTTWSCGASR